MPIAGPRPRIKSQSGSLSPAWSAPRPSKHDPAIVSSRCPRYAPNI
jgi:hypothetical protein